MTELYPKKEDGQIDWAKYHSNLIEATTLTHSLVLTPLFDMAQRIDWSAFCLHDSAVAALQKEYRKADKKKFTDLFLHSLSEPYSNAALYSLSVAKTFPPHELSEELSGQKCCTVCDSKPKFEEVFSREKLLTGCFERSENGDRNVYSLLLILKTVNECENLPKPSQEDIEIFKEIIALLQDTDLSAAKAVAEIKKCDFVKKWTQYRKADMKKQGKPCTNIAIRNQIKIERILATLGVCGILRTEKHKGAFYEYRRWSQLPYAGGGRSDLDYPVCWWNSKEGIDKEAFNFWFGTFSALKG